jgi:cyclophilin family peptidyl-prolyl cis-trans isomerase
MRDHHTSLKLLLACILVLACLSGISYFVDGAKSGERALSTRALKQSALPYQDATLVTSRGEIVIRLLPETAPVAVANFAKLAEQGFYDGTAFHRVIRGFMIQGGDPLTKEADTSLWGRGGPGYMFADEISGAPMIRGVVAMANSGPDSNGSQFFIIAAAETPWLSGKHSIFGMVTSGMEVVDSINKAAVNNTKDWRPMEPVRIEAIRLK